MDFRRGVLQQSFVDPELIWRTSPLRRGHISEQYSCGVSIFSYGYSLFEVLEIHNVASKCSLALLLASSSIIYTSRDGKSICIYVNWYYDDYWCSNENVIVKMFEQGVWCWASIHCAKTSYSNWRSCGLLDGNWRLESNPRPELDSNGLRSICNLAEIHNRQMAVGEQRRLIVCHVSGMRKIFLTGENLNYQLRCHSMENFLTCHTKN